MAKTATARAPRGTKIVAEAFFTAADEIPEAQRADVVKAALMLIRDRLKDARDKAKLARDKQKAKGAKTATLSKDAARPKAAAKAAPKKAAVVAKGAAPKKSAPKRARPSNGSRDKATQPASTPTDATTAPGDEVTL